MSHDQNIIINVYQKTSMTLYGDVLLIFAYLRLRFMPCFHITKSMLLHSEILKYSGNLTFHFCLPDIIYYSTLYTVQTMSFVQYYVEFLQKVNTWSNEHNGFKLVVFVL